MIGKLLNNILFLFSDIKYYDLCESHFSILCLHDNSISWRCSEDSVQRLRIGLS